MCKFDEHILKGFQEAQKWKKKVFFLKQVHCSTFKLPKTLPSIQRKKKCNSNDSLPALFNLSKLINIVLYSYIWITPNYSSQGLLWRPQTVLEPDMALVKHSVCISLEQIFECSELRKFDFPNFLWDLWDASLSIISSTETIWLY